MILFASPEEETPSTGMTENVHTNFDSFHFLNCLNTQG